MQTFSEVVIIHTLTTRQTVQSEHLYKYRRAENWNKVKKITLNEVSIIAEM
jgi:hypothetical protein